MVLVLDNSRALRTHDELVTLVAAILRADPTDETQAIERKRGFEDLTSTSSSFALARTVLGFANRPAATAASQFGGVGYIVVGAEPGSLVGQTIPDSAAVG